MPPGENPDRITLAIAAAAEALKAAHGGNLPYPSDAARLCVEAAAPVLWGVGPGTFTMVPSSRYAELVALEEAVRSVTNV